MIMMKSLSGVYVSADGCSVPMRSLHAPCDGRARFVAAMYGSKCWLLNRLVEECRKGLRLLSNPVVLESLAYLVTCTDV